MHGAYRSCDDFTDMASTTINRYRWNFVSGINGTTPRNDRAVTIKLISALPLIILCTQTDSALRSAVFRSRACPSLISTTACTFLITTIMDVAFAIAGTNTTGTENRTSVRFLDSSSPQRLATPAWMPCADCALLTSRRTLRKAAIW